MVKKKGIKVLKETAIKLKALIIIEEISVI